MTAAYEDLVDHVPDAVVDAVARLLGLPERELHLVLLQVAWRVPGTLAASMELVLTRLPCTACGHPPHPAAMCARRGRGEDLAVCGCVHDPANPATALAVHADTALAIANPDPTAPGR